MDIQHMGFGGREKNSMVWSSLSQVRPDKSLITSDRPRLGQLLKGLHFHLPIEIDHLGLLVMSSMLPHLDIIGDGVAIWDTRLEIADEHFSVFMLREEGFYLVNQSSTAMYEIQILDEGEAIELRLLSEGRIFPAVTLLARS